MKTSWSPGSNLYVRGWRKVGLGNVASCSHAETWAGGGRWPSRCSLQTSQATIVSLDRSWYPRCANFSFYLIIVKVLRICAAHWPRISFAFFVVFRIIVCLCLIIYSCLAVTLLFHSPIFSPTIILFRLSLIRSLFYAYSRSPQAMPRGVLLHIPTIDAEPICLASLE